MDTNYIGIYRILEAWPIWVIALLIYMVTMGVIFVFRDRCEGLFYNTSYSAMIGEASVLAIVLMAAEILKRGVALHWVLQCWQFHVVAFVVGMVIGLVWLFKTLPQEFADAYHNFVVVGLLIYLGITLLPVVFSSPAEMLATICLIVLWVGLIAYDNAYDRLDQRKYLGLDQHLKQLLMKRDELEDYHG